MNIYGRRKQVTSALQDDLKGSFSIVNAPDHPLLLRGPDVIVGSGAGVLAVFIPNAAEIKNYNLFETRFTLSRLAFPGETCSVLLIGDHLGDGLGNAYAKHFSEVLRPKDIRALSLLARQARDLGIERAVPNLVTRLAQKQFADVFHISQAMRRIKSRQEHASDSAESINKQASRRRAKIYDANLKGETLYVAFDEGTVSTDTMYPLMRERIENEYLLMDGVPFQRQEIPYGIASVVSLPVRYYDPEKLLRAAAFAGWVIVDKNSNALIPAIAKSLQSRKSRSFSK